MPNPKVCAICGWRKATTKDHLPPRGVFARPLPINMRTVPACADCNNGASMADERFRVYLAAITTYFNDDATRLWKEGVVNTLKKNRRLTREFAEAVRDRVRIEVRPGVIEERMRIVMPVSAYKPVIARIVRGLYYHHFDRALGMRNNVDVHMLTGIPDEFYAIANDWRGGDVGGQQFVYRYAYLDQIRTFWVLQFFESHWAWAETYAENGQPISPEGVAENDPLEGDMPVPEVEV
jgi:hypothetical protein